MQRQMQQRAELATQCGRRGGVKASSLERSYRVYTIGHRSGSLSAYMYCGFIFHHMLWCYNRLVDVPRPCKEEHEPTNDGSLTCTSSNLVRGTTNAVTSAANQHLQGNLKHSTLKNCMRCLLDDGSRALRNRWIQKQGAGSRRCWAHRKI